MLMKMSEYKSGTVFTVAICLSSILLAILVAYACNLDELEKAMNDAYSAYNAAESNLAAHQKLEPVSVAAGIVTGAPVAVFTTAQAAASAGALTAGSVAWGAGAGAVVIAGAYGAWYTFLVHYEGEVASTRSAYYEAVANYEACANPPERYTYTDYYGNVYEFSDKDSYNEFLSNRGHSTI